MAIQIQLRRDTGANWLSKDPVLAQGEVGIEVATGKSKVGDGVTAWTSLAYREYPSASGEEVFTSDEKEKLSAMSSLPGDCFALQGSCYLFDPSDATANVKYWGSIPSQPASTTAGYCKIYNPRQGQSWIRSVYIMVQTYTILGTAEATSMYLRVNDTADYLISNQIKNNATLLTVSATGLAIPLAGGDYFEFKWVIPQDVWATNPTGVRFSAALWLDAAGGPTGAEVSTITANPVGATTATLNGNLIDLGTAASVTCSFEYGLTTAYGSTAAGGVLTAPGSFHAALTSLPTTTLHHFRAKAVGDETVYGVDMTFTTGGSGNPLGLYGTMYYTGSDPIGGGAGYTNIITAPSPDDANHRITTSDTIATFLSKLAAATTGEIIYVNPDVNLNFYAATPVSGTNYNIGIPAGVTLASNRGYGGSAGGRLYTSLVHAGWYYFLKALGDHVTLNGLRIEGPSGSTSSTSNWAAFICSGYHGLEVENCEVYNFPYGGICAYTDGAAGVGGANFSSVDWAKAAYIHHCYIHNCRKSGLGYGIQLGASSALVEACNFNACRHFIEGERDGDWDPEGHTVAQGGAEAPAPTNGKECYCKAHYCVFGYGASPEANGTQFDMHGGSDTYLDFSHPAHEYGDRWGPYPKYGGLPDVWAGGEIEVKWCDFLVIGQGVVSIRGLPRYSWTVQWNWIKSCTQASQYTYLKQRLYTIPGYSDAPPYVVNGGEEINVSNNWWGSSTPPES